MGGEEGKGRWEGKRGGVMGGETGNLYACTIAAVVTITISGLLWAVHSLCTAAALVLAVRATRIARSAPVKRDTRVGKLEADYDDLHTRVQRLAGRIGRQAQKDAPDAPPIVLDDPRQQPGESAMDWKRRARGLAAQGKIKHEV
jgi:hypothetical protein